MSGTPHLAVEIAGETLWLLADKALYWPAKQTLLVADAHLGKAATYRTLGQPVPQGTTARNLQRLDDLLASYPTRRLVFLGDLLHARPARTGSTLAALQAWRKRHAELQIVLIRGNHDRSAGDPPADLAIEVVSEPWRMGPFALCHEPLDCPGLHVLAGHLHPVFVLRGRGRDRLRMPCFSVEQSITLLPAFGEFTGGMAIDSAPGRTIYGALDGAVWRLNQG
ncbi:ligase-associated DNA damage response endonuclease PdeM [Pseudomonas sp. MM211]|uniref:ligase-associated DNA damage response endonuclease PdeM n=1 Tax=Pseudomonas sp. MM211 TaxID=2866808 RepID=UPI001CED002A|nr:ligase-associated DNA damage response endonuclease PdeM [Pseudomonas sp. MM211]UCJ15232.1 ligase-associated DNA damage response endonuclease PdeM [Pseudomonas sp. MM211]